MDSYTKTIPYPIPEFSLKTDETLYIMLDGSQIDELNKRILQLDSHAEYEAIYLYEPWNELREVSPFLVQATPKIQQWFIQHNQPTHGYFFSSKQALSHLAKNFRRFIQVESPYGSSIFFKIGSSEAAAVLFKTSNIAIWHDITSVWLPTRLGWFELVQPPHLEKRASVQSVKLTDEQWSLLGDIQWLNILERLLHHVEKWFPHLAIQHAPNAVSWIESWASHAYQVGFVLEQDLLYYCNIVGFLGDDFEAKNEYRDITSLLTTPSLQTHSQRVEQAAHLAYTRHNKSNQE